MQHILKNTYSRNKSTKRIKNVQVSKSSEHGTYKKNQKNMENPVGKPSENDEKMEGFAPAPGFHLAVARGLVLPWGTPMASFLGGTWWYPPGRLT